MTMSDDRRWWREEADHVPKNLTEAIELQERLIQAGVAPAAAAGCVMWLVGKAHGEDHTTAPTRSRYRKLLAQLDGGDGGKPTRVIRREHYGYSRAAA